MAASGGSWPSTQAVVNDCLLLNHSMHPSPNQALQRAAIGIKCSAAGGLAKSAHKRWHARVLRGRRVAAELGS
jgi:hypothetical protein